MTATRVGHHQVLADEPTVSQITDRAGKPVVWQQVRTLLLDNDTIVYGCVHCDYTSPNLLSIRPHLGAHNRRTSTAAANGTISTDLKHLLHKLEQIDRLTRERDEWRSRAKVAESALATLRRALRP